MKAASSHEHEVISLWEFWDIQEEGAELWDILIT